MPMDANTVVAATSVLSTAISLLALAYSVRAGRDVARQGAAAMTAFGDAVSRLEVLGKAHAESTEKIARGAVMPRS